MNRLRVGLSPCPNDTFIFHALLAGRVAPGRFDIEAVIEDVEQLNCRALRCELEVTKISFPAYAQVRESYALLDAGAALGRGCGPLVVSRLDRSDLPLVAARIAVPGRWTTAALLLRLYEPHLSRAQLVEMPFDRILESVAGGTTDAGLIIHESRFTYAAHGLVARVDLGDWWEREERLPIPLGAIVARRDLGSRAIESLDDALRASVLHARSHPEDSRSFVRSHAQELADEVTEAHIRLYVNDFTVSLGDEGRQAIDRLLGLAVERGVVSEGD